MLGQEDAVIHLVRKRHDGDGWIVVDEIKTRPGPNQGRRADAIALSVWASKKYEAHLYEFKETREDLKREIRDPSKVEGVGRYCTYWWLCVRDEKLLADLVIPEAWGILTVHVDKVAGKEHQRFKVVRKAPKQKPEPIGILFAVELIRNIRNTYVDPTDHRKLQEELYQVRRGPKDDGESEDIKQKLHNTERELQRYHDMVARFEQRSGVDLGAASWDWGDIGEAVAVVRKIRESQLRNADIHADVARLSVAAEQLESRAAEIAESAVLLRSLMTTDHTKECRTHSGWGGRCNCGVVPLSKIERQIAGEQAAVAAANRPHAASAHDPEPEPLADEVSVGQ
jgi:hypothetical protein